MPYVSKAYKASKAAKRKERELLRQKMEAMEQSGLDPRVRG